MATKIRLKRLGGHRRPFYRIVVTDSRKPRDGRSIERLGFYDPLAQEDQVRIDAERLNVWLNKGAKPSDTVKQIIKRLSLNG